MRVSAKSVEGSATATQSASAQSTRQSFFDTLASVSSTPVQKAGADFEKQDSSENHSSDFAHNQDQSSKSFSLQSKENQEASNRDHQGESASHSTQQVDSKADQSSDQTASEGGATGTGVRKSDGSSSKRAAFTVQVATPFVLQSSTALPEPGGMFPASAMATGTDGVTSNADSPEQLTEAQFANVNSGQGSNLQGPPGAEGPIVIADVQHLRAEQGSDAEQVSDVLKAAGSTAKQVELEMASNDQASDSKNVGNVAAQLSAASGASDANSIPAFDPTSMLQASIEADGRKDSGARPSDANVNQPTLKATQSKSSGSAFGLNSDAGDSSKTAKSGDCREDSASLNASLQTLSTQPGGAHVSAADAKGGDAGALQTAVVAAQTESHGTTGTHAAAGSTETTAHRGNGSEGLTSEELNGSELAGMSGISAARLIQAMGTSEMRVGMHSSEFGDISIRTSVSQQQMQTQISVDHRELGNALSAQITNMQAKLGSEYGLHATIEVNQSGASFSSDGDRSQQHQQQAVARRAEIVDGSIALQGDMMSLSGSAVASSNSRLDIRA